VQNIGGGGKYSMAPQPNYWRGHGPPGPPYRAPHDMMKQMLTIIVYNRFSFTPFQKLPALTGGQKSISRHNAYINVLSCR